MKIAARQSASFSPVTPVDRILDVESFTNYSAESIASDAAACEEAGASGFWSVERMHDPFLPLALASTRTARISLGTSIAVALSRSPMTIAYPAHDLQALTNGRFILGLGPQHKSHIANRFSMPSDHPLERMREYVAALRAIWGSWNSQIPLNFRGKYYHHTLMPAFVTPPPNPFGPPPIFLAAVGPKMSELAGEVADGLIAPPFATPKYLSEAILPAVERGLSKSSRPRSMFTVMCLPMSVVARTAAEHKIASNRAKQQLAQYSSPLDARAVFNMHGLGHMGDEVTDIFMSGQPDPLLRMQGVVTDDILHTFTVSGTPESVFGVAQDRYHGLADRVAPVVFSGDSDNTSIFREALQSMRTDRANK